MLRAAFSFTLPDHTARVNQPHPEIVTGSALRFLPLNPFRARVSSEETRRCAAQSSSYSRPANKMSTSLLATLRVEATKTRSIVLVLLVMQTTAAVLLMRYSRTAPRPAGSGPPYLVSLGSGLGSGLGVAPNEALRSTTKREP